MNSYCKKENEGKRGNDYTLSFKKIEEKGLPYIAINLKIGSTDFKTSRKNFAQSNTYFGRGRLSVFLRNLKNAPEINRAGHVNISNLEIGRKQTFILFDPLIGDLTFLGYVLINGFEIYAEFRVGDESAFLYFYVGGLYCTNLEESLRELREDQTLDKGLHFIEILK